MSNIPDREIRIERVRHQMECSKLYAQLWIARATTGEATQRDIKRGREPTPEERAKGEVIGWNPLTDQEKIADALNTATAHVDNYRKAGEVLCALLEDDLDSYNMACRIF